MAMQYEHTRDKAKRDERYLQLKGQNTKGLVKWSDPVFTGLRDAKDRMIWKTEWFVAWS